MEITSVGRGGGIVDILSFYSDVRKRKELAEILTLGAQRHPEGLDASFLEKDVWVTEILRLLYNEKLIGDYAIAFKGGTALSKCWKAIGRFSEDIDLSIHWSDLSEDADEKSAWEKSTSSRNQKDRFRKKQEERLTEWSCELTKTLNHKFSEYNIDELKAEWVPESKGEKVLIYFPWVTSNTNSYQFDKVLLEFGGRNRGRPTSLHSIGCYLSEISELKEIVFPAADVQALDPGYILWEKITALHQFSTQEKDINPYRLARHWYDVDCLLKNSEFSDHLNNLDVMEDVVVMKRARWAERGVDYEDILRGNLLMIPDENRLKAISSDHQEAIDGGMFFSKPDSFVAIIDRLHSVQEQINRKIK